MIAHEPSSDDQRVTALVVAPLIVIATLMRDADGCGVQTHFRQLRDHLQRRGLAVEVVTPFSAPLWRLAPVIAMRRLLGFIGPFDVWWYRHWHTRLLRTELRRLTASGRPMTIYAQCPLSAGAALDVRVGPQQRVVLVTHYNHSQAHEWFLKAKIKEGGPLYRAIQIFERDVLPRVDALVHPGTYLKAYLEATVPGVKGRPGIQSFHFLPAAKRPMELQHQGDLVTVGALEDTRKNQSFLIRIVAEAKRLGRHITLTVIGGGLDYAKLVRLAVDLGVADRVTFRGHLDDAGEFVWGHSIYVHAAILEVQPYAILEAMARGLPILAVPSGGIPDIFSDESEGRYLDADDVGLSTKCILEVLNDDALRARLGAAALQRFSSTFEETVVAERLVKFLQGDLRDELQTRASAPPGDTL